MVYYVYNYLVAKLGDCGSQLDKCAIILLLLVKSGCTWGVYTEGLV